MSTTDSGFDAASLQKARETFRKFSSFAPPPNVFRVADATNSVRSQFPVQLGTTDPEDEKFSLRSNIVNNEGDVPGVGKAEAGDDYFNYMERKREQANMFEFMKYIMSQADLTKPEAADWWYRKFPWMQDLRIQEINRQSEIQKRLAIIQVSGPQSEDDFMLLFMNNKKLLGDVDRSVTLLNDKTLDAQSGNAFIPGMFSFFSRSDRLFLTNDPKETMVSWSNPIAKLTAIASGSQLPTGAYTTDNKATINAIGKFNVIPAPSTPSNRNP
jgi:hypothetical protein